MELCNCRALSSASIQTQLINAPSPAIANFSMSVHVKHSCLGLYLKPRCIRANLCVVHPGVILGFRVMLLWHDKCGHYY